MEQTIGSAGIASSAGVQPFIVQRCPEMSIDVQRYPKMSKDVRRHLEAKNRRLCTRAVCVLTDCFKSKVAVQ